MEQEKNARRILAIGVLFATVGIIALAVTLLQSPVQSEQERLAEEIFAPTPEEKHEILAELAATASVSDAPDSPDAPATGSSEDEKLRVLDALRD